MNEITEFINKIKCQDIDNDQIEQSIGALIYQLILHSYETSYIIPEKNIFELKQCYKKWSKFTIDSFDQPSYILGKLEILIQIANNINSEKLSKEFLNSLEGINYDILRIIYFVGEADIKCISKKLDLPLKFIKQELNVLIKKELIKYTDFLNIKIYSLSLKAKVLLERYLKIDETEELINIFQDLVISLAEKKQPEQVIVELKQNYEYHKVEYICHNFCYNFNNTLNHILNNTLQYIETDDFLNSHNKKLEYIEIISSKNTEWKPFYKYNFQKGEK
ncbi:MAG: hypothetical protein KAX49_05645 [Halanaerobiales bacterium]|nr:hypothetical protein [Halanaerobiales bacterium]